MKKIVILMGILMSFAFAKSIDSISALKLGTDITTLEKDSYKDIGDGKDKLRCIRSNQDLNNNNTYLNIGFSDIVYCSVENKIFSIEYVPSNSANNEFKVALEKEFDRQFVLAKLAPSLYVTEFDSDRSVSRAIRINLKETGTTFLIQDIKLYKQYEKIFAEEKNKSNKETNTK